MKPSLALCLFTILTVSAGAQTQAPQSSEVFSDVIDVRVINVEVYVTDDQGRPVTNLAQSDFELFDDGKKVEITNFEAITEQVSTKETGAKSAVPASPTQQAPQGEISESERLNLVVLVDNYNLRPQTRNRVLKQLDDFLGNFRDDRVMIMTNDLGLQVRRPFAAPAHTLKEDLNGLTRLAARGPLTDNFARQTLERIQEYGCTSEASVEARNYVRQMHNDTVVTLSALEHVMESLSGLEGRKALVYVSDGLPLRPGEEVVSYLAKICGDQSGNPFDVEDVANELRRVTTAANANRVTLYTLEAAGLRGFTSVSVESTNSFQTPTMDFIQNANVQDTLFNLASETGGRAVLSTNDLQPQLAKIKTDLQTYYSLGYAAPTTGSGRVHDLKVVVKRPGLKARCRKTYRDSTREERMLARLGAALWHGVGENPLGVNLFKRADSKPEGKRHYLVPVRVRIPLSKVTLLPDGEAFSGRLSLLVSSRDKEGRYAPPRRVPIPLQVTSAEMATPKWVDLDLVMKKGEYVVALGVLDEIGGATSFVHQDLKVEGSGKITGPPSAPVVRASGPSPGQPATRTAVAKTGSSNPKP